MSTAELTELESQVDYLIQSVKQLKSENLSLRHQLASNAKERSRLHTQNQKAAEQVKKIVSQLKDELL